MSITVVCGCDHGKAVENAYICYYHVVGIELGIMQNQLHATMNGFESSRYTYNSKIFKYCNVDRIYTTL